MEFLKNSLEYCRTDINVLGRAFEMSRKVLLTIALLAACLACSCSWGYGRLIIHDDGPTKADARLEQILEALENEDSDALREMFSKNARDEASDFDESMDCLFKYFTGNIESWERTGSGGSTSSHLGDRSVLQRSYYNVATDVVVRLRRDTLFAKLSGD